MNLLDAINNPKEVFFKRFFSLTTLLVFLAIPLLNNITHLDHFFKNPLLQNIGFNPTLLLALFLLGNFLVNSLITYLLYSHAVVKKRNGFLTFWIVFNSLCLLLNTFQLIFYFKGTLNPLIVQVIESNFSLFLINQFICMPIWLFFGWKIRRINQLHFIKESIQQSTEAMGFIQILEAPSSLGSIQQAMEYLLLRLPPSQQKLIEPLCFEARRRLELATSLN
ncbi:MAG: hypothetical protein FJZ61_04705 [Chlamydiae bacterium]|nr:hypothetical protein [Chlamydiota bacterium]